MIETTSGLKAFIEDFMGMCYHDFNYSVCTKCGLVMLFPPQLQSKDVMEKLREHGQTRAFFLWLQEKVGLDGFNGGTPQTLDFWVTWDTAPDWAKVELVIGAFDDGAIKKPT